MSRADKRLIVDFDEDLTSTAIDATLYDKLSAVCSARQVREMHFSVLELERAVAEAPILRQRYFEVETRRSTNRPGEA